MLVFFLWLLLAIWIILSVAGLVVVAQDTIESQGLGSHSNNELVLFGVIGLLVSLVYTALLMVQFIFEPKKVIAEIKNTFKTKKFRGRA